MSVKGINIAANIFHQMQLARIELIRLGGQDVGTFEGNQDILLGQLLSQANDAVKDEFAEAVAGTHNAIKGKKPKDL